VTTQTKVLLGAAAVIAVIVILRRRASANTGNVILAEFTVARDSQGRCGCFQIENLADGTVKSTKVARSKCEAEVNLRQELQNCDGGGTGFPDIDIITTA